MRTIPVPTFIYGIKWILIDGWFFTHDPAANDNMVTNDNDESTDDGTDPTQ